MRVPSLFSKKPSSDRDETLKSELDKALWERNQLVGLFAQLFPSGIRRIGRPGWPEEWHNVVIIDFPSGQASFFYHDQEAHIFKGLPEYTKPWHGEDREHQTYRTMRRYREQLDKGLEDRKLTASQ